MAIKLNQKEQQIEALKENIQAIEFCLNFDKSLNPIINPNIGGCLGYPAMILICSVFDTVGSFFRGANTELLVDGANKKIETVNDHFLILNHSHLFNLKLNGATIYDFYSTYRSKLTHNNALPPNNFLKADKNDPNIFNLNNEKEITCINIIPLFEVLKKGIVLFIHWLENGTWSSDHKLAKELQEKSKAPNLQIVDPISFSGSSGTIYYP
jgi:hypothetical protein